MSTNTRFSTGLFVEIEMAVLIIIAQVVGELLALLNYLFIRIEF